MDIPAYDPSLPNSSCDGGRISGWIYLKFYTNNDAERIALAEAVQGYLERRWNPDGYYDSGDGAYSSIIDNNNPRRHIILGATCTTIEAEKILSNFVSTAAGMMNTSGYRNEEYDAAPCPGRPDA